MIEVMKDQNGKPIAIVQNVTLALDRSQVRDIELLARLINEASQQDIQDNKHLLRDAIQKAVAAAMPAAIAKACGGPPMVMSHKEFTEFWEEKPATRKKAAPSKGASASRTAKRTAPVRGQEEQPEQPRKASKKKAKRTAVVARRSKWSSEAARLRDYRERKKLEEQERQQDIADAVLAAEQQRHNTVELVPTAQPQVQIVPVTAEPVTPVPVEPVKAIAEVSAPVMVEPPLDPPSPMPVAAVRVPVESACAEMIHQPVSESVPPDDIEIVDADKPPVLEPKLSQEDAEYLAAAKKKMRAGLTPIIETSEITKW